MWDWSVCLDESARYENMVASHLLKFCNLWEDAKGEEMDLQFLRNAQGKEIDFVVVKKSKALVCGGVQNRRSQPQQANLLLRGANKYSTFFPSPLGIKRLRGKRTPYPRTPLQQAL